MIIFFSVEPTVRKRDQLIKFEFKLAPSDMKWLAKFSGVLSNSAKYPCSFANVLLSELNERGGSLGNDPHNKWKPWSYTFRVEVARKVENFKKLQRKPTNSSQEQTLRTKICNYIACLKSRQEFEPVIGPVIQNGKCDPLHLGNNCWGHCTNCFPPMFCLKQRFLLVQNLFLICLIKNHRESI